MTEHLTTLYALHPSAVLCLSGIAALLLAGGLFVLVTMQEKGSGW